MSYVELDIYGSEPVDFETINVLSACATRDVTVVTFDGGLPPIEPGQTIGMLDPVTGRALTPAAFAIGSAIPRPR